MEFPVFQGELEFQELIYKIDMKHQKYSQTQTLCAGPQSEWSPVFSQEFTCPLKS